MKGNTEIMRLAAERGIIIPAFNIPYLPMMEPVIRALTETDAFAFAAVARLEWEKFGAVSPRAVRDEYLKNASPHHTRLHLDHVPVIDEDGKLVDYLSIIREALSLGYDSVMVDGSRLPLAGNIEATAAVCAAARGTGIPVEGELGAVLGHEAGPLPPYEELFSSKRGFTDSAEARQFVEETGVDWLSVAIGNIHGAITPAARNTEKLAARLDIGHLVELRKATGIPLVLHGGSGIPHEYLEKAFTNGIAKINIGTDIRKAFEAKMDVSMADAREAVRIRVHEIVSELGIAGSAAVFRAEE